MSTGEEFQAGDRYGDRVVLCSRTTWRRDVRIRLVKCRCKCGSIDDVNAADLRRGVALRCSSCAAYLRWNKEPELAELSDRARDAHAALCALLSEGIAFSDIEAAFCRLVVERDTQSAKAKGWA